jgi:DNA polymerase-3 subunit gamma/tau
MAAQTATDAQGRSLYRRHRPRTFADVVGQEPVVRTLRNAVSQGRVHHAYLFVGSRGTGKTSMAKILAAALDCEHGPTTEPCGECDACRAIAAATSLDVIEMDAASNNSVDDIRELRERIAIAPVSGRHKVYILDEAHMLTQAAWNAFLKTLEEPPPATVFVLATTEAQKVPATVVDRCHRFDFCRPSSEQIAGVVRRVADAEGMELPPEAVAAIARSARGSFRDALGTLEQLLTYTGPHAELGDVLALLGVAEAELLERILDAVRDGDAAAVLTTLAECSERGRDPSLLASDLEACAREILIVKTLGGVPAELSLTPESDARLAAQGERLDRALLVRVLDLLATAREAVRAGADARTQLELALVKAACPEIAGPEGALLGRLERLEAKLAALPGEMPAGASRAVADEPREGAAEHAATPPTEDGLAHIRARWPEVLDAIRARNALLGALLAEARPVGAEGEAITVAFPSGASFLRRKAEDGANLRLVTATLKEVLGRPVRVSYELREDVVPEPHTPAEEELIAQLIAELGAEELPVAELSEQP